MWRITALAALGRGCLAILSLVGTCAAELQPTSPETVSSQQRADQLVRTALAFEVDGDNQYRQLLLKAACQAMPDHGPANWHLGRVRIDECWVDLPTAQRAIASDRQLAEYRRKCDPLWGTTAGEFHLALWCDEHDLPDRAKLHFRRVLSANDADQMMRAHAVRQLGLQSVGGVLMTPEEIQKLEERAEQQSKAIQRWRPRLEQLRRGIESSSAQRHADGWWEWWDDYCERYRETPEYSYRDDRTYCYISHILTASCFAAGTTVWLDRGATSIEEVRPGDRVLAQDPETGQLGFKPVTQTTIRPPVSIMRLTVGNDSILTTLGHPLWVVSQGWRMAKHVQVGNWLHGLEGSQCVEAIERMPAPQEAYNLVVDDYHSYFVGAQGLLVHDNTYRQPVAAAVPGLRLERSYRGSAGN